MAKPPRAIAPKQAIQDEEEDEYQDDYYDDEDYDQDIDYGEEDYNEEEPSEQGEEEIIEDKSDKPMEFTKEEISQIYFMKKNFPEVAKVCAHFITRACLFGDTCREKHD